MKKKTILSIVALLIVVLAIFGITKFVGAEGKGGGADESRKCGG